ncbi:MAG: peptide chain release factor N(5)-glutamine methyltransferase [Alphaproteobacteria bacterium]|nr:peptide chain release factor N(5)-glutamine methyltransferase [Alphaproteobacteria bacterium]MCB9698524.1 peptide chain release factor N(5)-glutamine methyltransferase [Alphaproteobacteria bacterium]
MASDQGPAPLVDILVRTEGFLRSKGITSPRLEAELLLAHVLKVQRLQLYLAHDRPMSTAELAELRPLVARRGRREPLSWILGHRGFHAIELVIRPGVLDPRPDTETLVEALLGEVPKDDPGPVYVADIGCGSGAVGLAIAHARPAVRLYAVDLDPNALAVTKENVATLGLTDRVGVLRGDLLDAIPANRPIHWVVSNPPYIPTGEIDGLMPEVSQHEPRRALDGGRDGLDVVRRLVTQASQRARTGLLMEIGHDQAGRAADLLRRAGFVDIRTWDDLQGIARVVGGRIPGRP